MKTHYKKKDQIRKELENLRKKLIKNEKIRQEFEYKKDNFESIINSVPIGFDVVSYDYEIQFQNNYLQNIFGNHKGKLCYKNYMGRSKPCSKCPMRKAIESKKLEKAEIEGFDDRSYEILSMPIQNNDGTISAIEIVIDITQKKLHEAYLHLNTLFQEARDAILIADLESGIILNVNKQAERLFKRDRSELIGMHQVELHPSEESVKYQQIFREHADSGIKEPVEAEIVTSDGQKVPVEINSSLIQLHDKKQVLQGIFRDITERKRTEEQLTIFKKFAGASSLAYGLADLNGDIVYINLTLCRILGEEKLEDALGKNVEIYYPDNMKTKLLNEVLPTVKREDRWTGELPLQSIKGKVTFTVQNIFLVYDDKGKPIYIGNIITDITERIKAEQNSQDAKDFAESIMNSLPGMFYMFDKNGQIFRWNKNLETVSGYSAEEIGKMKALDFIVEEDRDIVMSRIQEAFLKGQSTVEARFLTKNKGGIPYLFTGFRFVSGDQTYLIGMGIDVTEQREARETLQKHEGELKKRVKELEDFYEIAVGRELRMVELKEKIKKLEAELAKKTIM